IATFIKDDIRPARAPIPANDPVALKGRALFGQVGLVQPHFSCATCHGGRKWSKSVVDFSPPPSPEIELGLGNERVIGAELRQTATQSAESVLNDVGTFTLAGGRLNEIRSNPADISQVINPLGMNGFNIPSLLGVHQTAPYFYSGMAQSLDQVLDGSSDG